MRVLTAGTAAEGVALFRTDRPDVVVLDVRLPDASGLDAFRRLQEIDPKVPVILITGHGTAETAIEAMRLGAFDYLLKPLDPDPLRDLLGRAFEISRLMRVPAKVPAAEDGRRRGRRAGRQQPGHAGGVQGDRPGRPAGRDRADPGRERAPARSWWPGPSTTTAGGPTGRSWPSTARPSRRACWRASCSGTRRGRSPGPTAGGSASSSRPTAAPCSWTRSAT